MKRTGEFIVPSGEERSFPLRVTVGCSHNACTFCDLYRGLAFSASLDYSADLERARACGLMVRRVFLGDGDALVLDTRRLVTILEQIREILPGVEGVACYGDTRSLVGKSAADLRHLREMGLDRIYHGLESGSDRILARVNKGGTRAEALAMAAALREAGMAHVVLVMLGLGGVEDSRLHARETASALSAIDPAQVSVWTVRAPAGSPLSEAGNFRLPDQRGILRELLTLLEESVFTRCLWRSPYPQLPGRLILPPDRDRALASLRLSLSGA